MMQLAEHLDTELRKAEPWDRTKQCSVGPATESTMYDCITLSGYMQLTSWYALSQ